MKKRKNRLLVALIIALSLFFTLSPFNYKGFLSLSRAQWLGEIVIDHDTVWKKTDNLVFSKRVRIKNGAKLTIEKGAVIKFTQGGDIWIPSLSVDDGSIIAEGTQEEKIIFTNVGPDDHFAIDFDVHSQASPSFFRYVDFLGLGYMPQAIYNNKFSAAYAMGIGGVKAFSYYAGKVHLENCEFKDSPYGDIEVEAIIGSNNPDDYLEVSNSNFYAGDENLALQSKVYCSDEDGCGKYIYLKNNWYNHWQGPTIDGAPMEIGKRVSGNFKLDGWRANDIITDPVIIIPGIMGSAKAGNLGWMLDPIAHTYDNLVSSLKRNGLEEGKNLFEFPYEWRNSNEITAGKLKDKISEIKTSAKVSKVDLVAHSMGGLVARQYIENSDYNNDVDELITLGTPNGGSPEAYLKWEAGEGFSRLSGLIMKYHFKNEAKHQGYSDLKSYIQDKIISVKELLPDSDYLLDVKDGFLRNYPTNYPENNFLEDLNKNDSIENFKKVNSLNVVGDLSANNSTVSKIRVIPTTVSGSWEHGMPENFYDTSSNRGLEYGSGDETVPESSAKAISADKIVELDSTHSDLPTKAQCLVFKELTGKTDCHYYADIHIPNIFLLNIFSPVDVQVIAPDGKRVGKNFQTGEIVNEIEGAYYTGYDTDSEMLTIPNPADGEYKIMTQGTGSGAYTLEAVKISENQEDPKNAIESVAEINGTAQTGKIEENAVEINGNEIVAKSKDSEPPVISINNPKDGDNLLNNKKILIDFKVQDNVSETENIKSELYLDGKTLSDKNLDLSLQKLGSHKIKVWAVDEVQNLSQKEANFSLKTNIDAIITNLGHYYDLGMIKNRTDKGILDVLVNNIRSDINLLSQVKNGWFFNAQNKKTIVSLLQNYINYEIDFLIGHIQRKPDKIINAQAKTLLIESLESIKF